jgi:hypothetical protein
VRGLQRNARPPSVSEAARLGELVHWSDPLAVTFGRRMFAAVRGRAAPPDLDAASLDDRSVVGAFASQWVKDFSKTLDPSQFEVFCERCSRDIGKKRGRSGIKDLGAVAMAKIVPGVLRSMSKERN